MGLKALRFGNINSLDYGVGITGEGVYSAPERDVEIINIQGRNGDYILDNGRFNNIEVVYHAVMGDVTQPKFAKKLSDFRNALLSQVGYQRIEDDYSPDEYRMGVCVGGIAISPAQNSMGAEFDMRFNCKPQRFLKAGEQEITVATGDKLYNPTPFEARPLIIVTADDDGVLNVNDQQIRYLPESIGNISLDNSRPTTQKIASGAWTSSATASWTFSRYNTGDNITPDIPMSLQFTVEYPSVSGVNVDSGGLTNMTLRNATHTTHYALFNLAIPRSALSFTAGTAKTVSYSFYGIVEYESDPQSGTLGSEVEFAGTVAYDGDSTITVTASGDLPEGASTTTYNLEVFPQFYVDSTRATFEGAVYFDTDVCEAYVYDGSDMISVNNVIVAGADFPKLVAGINNISYTGGIQSCKIIPRWWLI